MQLTSLQSLPVNKKVPRILISAGMIQSGLSGVGRYVCELAQRLAPCDAIELHVAGLKADRHLFPTLAEKRWIEMPERAARGAINLLWHQGPLRHLLKRHRFDLYHSPSYRRVMAFCPVPQIATIHDCAPFHLRSKYGALRGLFGRQLAPWMARRCKHIITVSAFTGTDIEKFFSIPATRIEVIHNGLNHDIYRPPTAAECDDFRRKKDLQRAYFLYLSRLEHPGKNHIRLIEAYDLARSENLTDLPLVLGGAPWHGAAAIYARAEASPFRKDIHFPGFMDEAELPLWYGAAAALVFPSLIEGFGLPVAEAMACGTPVIASDRGSLPEVGGEAALYFDPSSGPSILEGLRAFCRLSASDLEALQQKGFAQASQFHWNLAASRTRETYQRVYAQTSMTSA